MATYEIKYNGKEHNFRDMSDLLKYIPSILAVLDQGQSVNITITKYHI